MSALIVIFSIVSVILMALFTERVYRQHRHDKKEMIDILMKCREIEKKANTRGIVVFQPPDNETYLYDKLVDKGYFKKNPVGGYCFNDEGYDKTWKGVPTSFARPKGGYKDDDGVLSYIYNENGVQVPWITEKDVTEGKLKEKNDQLAEKIKQSIKIDKENKNGNR